MKIKRLNFIFIFSAILLVSTSCLRMDQINIRDLEDITITSLNDDIIKMEMSFIISNPNDFRFRVSDVNLDIIVGDKVIGNISDMPPFDLLPDSVQSLKLPVSIDLKVLESEGNDIVKTLIKKGGRMRVKGYFSARAFLFTMQVEVDKERRINIFKSLFG